MVSQIITDLAVFDVTDGGLVAKQLAPGISREALQTHTEPQLTFDCA